MAVGQSLWKNHFLSCICQSRRCSIKWKDVKCDIGVMMKVTTRPLLLFGSMLRHRSAPIVIHQLDLTVILIDISCLCRLSPIDSRNWASVIYFLPHTMCVGEAHLTMTEYARVAVFCWGFTQADASCSLLVHMAAGAYVRQSVERADSGQNGSCGGGQEVADKTAPLSCTRFAPGWSYICCFPRAVREGRPATDWAHEKHTLRELLPELSKKRI